MCYLNFQIVVVVVVFVLIHQNIFLILKTCWGCSTFSSEDLSICSRFPLKTHWICSRVFFEEPQCLWWRLLLRCLKAVLASLIKTESTVTCLWRTHGDCGDASLKDSWKPPWHHLWGALESPVMSWKTCWIGSKVSFDTWPVLSVTLLPQPPNCWDYKHELLPSLYLIFNEIC